MTDEKLMVCVHAKTKKCEFTICDGYKAHFDRGGGCCGKENPWFCSSELGATFCVPISYTEEQCKSEIIEATLRMNFIHEKEK